MAQLMLQRVVTSTNNLDGRSRKAGGGGTAAQPPIPGRVSIFLSQARVIIVRSIMHHPYRRIPSRIGESGVLTDP
jgi:hypothetical protein